MTSKLVVNTIESDTGISSVSFASSISMSSTSKFFFSAAGIDIGADTNINRPEAGVLGFNINGPFVSDSFFIKDFKNYNVIVGMYHDQVLIPFKSIFKFDAINITLGLKYLRVSPDHGVARNLIKKNKANYKSLLKCIKFINKFGR